MPRKHTVTVYRSQRNRLRLPLLLALVGTLALTMLPRVIGADDRKPDHKDRFSGPLSSQPIALSADDRILAVANTDNNSVSFFHTKQHRKFAEVKVEKEPSGVALTPDGKLAFVTNTASGTVSVIRVSDHDKDGWQDDKRWDSKFLFDRDGDKDNDKGFDKDRIKDFLKDLFDKDKDKDKDHKDKDKDREVIHVGVEPYGIVMSPNGTRVYVANARSNSISVIDVDKLKIVDTIKHVGPEPRGLAITNNGNKSDVDETLYVTQFLSTTIPGKIDGADDAKTGHVFVISAATNTVLGQITLNPIADTGFKAAGDALARIPPGPDFIFTTGAYPNQLNTIAIHKNFAYVPNTGASPNGPVRFNVNTQSLLHVIDRFTNSDADKTINMHLAVAQQTSPQRLFITQPWTMAFKQSADTGYVLSAASNILVRIDVDAAGNSNVALDPDDPTRVLQIKLGKNPRGIVIDSEDKFAFVANFISRDVSVVDLRGTREQVIATLQSADRPAPGSPEDVIHIGKELYNTSVGEFDPATMGGPPIVGRMSAAGWGACSTCHTPFGLTDNVVWIFPSGPKRTIPQHTDFDPTDPTRTQMRPLNWSGERDEEEDFELNIRAVSGGLGMIVLADGVTQDPNVFNFLPLASGNRNQLKIRGVGGWDAIKAFVQFGIRAPISPFSKTDPDAVAGRALFIAANCQSCHGTGLWTTARIRFTPPPDPALINAGGELFSELRSVGTFDPTFFNEVRQNAAAPLGANGFVPPSLLSIFAFAEPFFHNGGVPTLDAVLENVTHRSAGTGGVDTLTNAADRAKIVQFLLTIDANSAPIP